MSWLAIAAIAIAVIGLAVLAFVGVGLWLLMKSNPNEEL